jgi:vacuolar-type H+-ATPase subunit C/Vma6
MAAAAGGDAPEDVLARLARLEVPSIWLEPMARWSRREDLPRLERDLDAEATRWTISLFWRGDPLGIAIPTAFVAAKENEARNLRLLAYGAEQGLAADAVMQELVMPW